MIAALLFVAALAADPVGARPEAAVASAPARPSPIADTDIREFAAIAGRKVVGRPVGGPYANADKILLIARNDKGYPAVANSIGFPVRQSLPSPPATTLSRPCSS